MTTKIYSINDIKEMLKEVFEDTEVKKAILFGSYAKNTPTVNSDIDLVIDSDGKLLNIKFYGILEELIEKLKKKVDLIEISELKKNSDIYKNIEKEGIIVYEK